MHSSYLPQIGAGHFVEYLHYFDVFAIRMGPVIDGFDAINVYKIASICLNHLL